MNIGTELSTLSMGHSINSQQNLHRKRLGSRIRSWLRPIRSGCCCSRRPRFGIICVSPLTTDLKLHMHHRRRCTAVAWPTQLQWSTSSRPYTSVLSRVWTPSVTFIMQLLQRRDRIQLPVVVEIISNVCKSCMTKVTEGVHSSFSMG